jgi:predicted nucleic acid-binding protein
MDYRYWDTVTFLGWLAAEPDKVAECRPVIEAAEGGSIVLVTSALTLTEVLWLKGHGQQKLSAQHAKKIEDFFRHQWIVVREVDRFIAEAARDVVWGKNIKPKDAIHIATALQQDVQFDQFDTFDRDLIKLSGTIGSPPLTIGRPNLPPNLPLFEKEDEDL